MTRRRRRRQLTNLMLLTPRSSGAVASGQVEITFTTSVDETPTDDLGAIFQGVGPHTHYGGAIYFDSDQYLYTVVNGLGVDPGVSGTGHAVTLTGAAPFSATAWATAAETAISGAGYSVSRSTNVLTVTVASAGNASAAAAAQAGLRSFNGIPTGRVIGATQQDAGSSANSDTTGWIQVLPSSVPANAFRVIAFGIRRGSNVTAGVRMGLASGGTADFDIEAAVVDSQRTMGNSGANNWHYEYLETPVEYSGGDRLWLGFHGDGANSSIFAGGAVNTGTNEDGTTNLWLTDGTSGSTTPIVSPVGSVTSSFNFGVSGRIIIQEADGSGNYVADGNYRVLSGAIEGRHDTGLTQTEVDAIFVGWRLETPDVDDLYVEGARLQLQTHGATAAEQLRWEMWNPVGGASTMAGDTLVSLIGLTATDQGTGWSDLTVTRFAVSSNTEYRYTVKSEPVGGSTLLNVDTGGFSQNLAGHPVYGPGGATLASTEREVLANNPGGTDETAIDFDPTVATVSPNPSNGQVESPNNEPMFAVVLGKSAPTVVSL